MKCQDQRTSASSSYNAGQYIYHHTNILALNHLSKLSDSAARPGVWDLFAHFLSPRLPSEFEDNYDEDDDKG